jgi:beta-xylosidase
MKKALFMTVVTSVLVFISCATALNYPEPEFDKPFVYVIDTFKLDGSFEDYVKLHNNSSDSDIKFNIYVHDPDDQEWLIYGTGVLEGADDTDTIDSDIDDVDDYRYFAIQSLDDKNYQYRPYKSRNDLHITISDN